MLIYKKKEKNMINKCYSSTIRVQNGLKTQLKRAFYIKKKLLIILTYLSKNSLKNKFFYFPMQKSLKMLPKISSTSTLPTIIPRCLVASRKSSAALSKSSVWFFSSKFFR